MSDQAAVDAAVGQIRQALTEAGIEFEEPSPAAFVANLPGQRRLKTACWLFVGRQGLAVEAFVIRKPDENAADVHRWLLAHNARMFAVSWSIDDDGDIYLTGRLPLPAVTAEVVDQLLGVVLDYADTASTPCWNWASARPSPGSGPGGRAAASRWPTWPRSPGSCAG
ncbi:MAG TPA: YbjN domain-containing protein, partial [Jatrophihabitans sp.]|nr:YbjN domain-containing protein [Jatrophihabitans sp.]